MNKIGYIGLGKMGSNMVERLLEQGVDVVAWNRSDHKLKNTESIEDLASQLGENKIIWLMLPHGKPTDEILRELLPYLKKGDIVIDGANANYKETLGHSELLAEKGVKFLDVGVSGGPGGARNGACLMVGGEEEYFNQLKWIFEKIAAPDAYGYFGEVGSGHYAKMVHNGIEYGMMQAIAEGATILKNNDKFNFNLAEVLRVYNNASVIESRLVGWAKAAVNEDETLEKISSKINHSGEGEWTVQEASRLNIDIPVIRQSLRLRKESEKVDPNSAEGFRNKVVSALRNKFGGHEVSVDKTL